MPYRAYNPRPSQLHPEFGYLSPSRQRRFSVRIALAATSFGLVVGVAGATVLHQRADSSRLETVLPAVDTDAAGAGGVVTADTANATPAGITPAPAPKLPRVSKTAAADGADKP